MKISSILLSVVLLLGFTAITSAAQDKRQAELSHMNKQALLTYLAQGMAPDIQREIAFVMTSTDKHKLEALKQKMQDKGQNVGKVWVLKKEPQATHYVLEFVLQLALNDREKLLNYSELVDNIAKENDVHFIGWAARN